MNVEVSLLLRAAGMLVMNVRDETGTVALLFARSRREQRYRRVYIQPRSVGVSKRCVKHDLPPKTQLRSMMTVCTPNNFLSGSGLYEMKLETQTYREKKSRPLIYVKCPVVLL